MGRAYLNVFLKRKEECLRDFVVRSARDGYFRVWAIAQMMGFLLFMSCNLHYLHNRRLSGHSIQQSGVSLQDIFGYNQIGMLGVYFC